MLKRVVKSTCKACDVTYLSFNDIAYDICPVCCGHLSDDGELLFTESDISGIYPAKLNSQTAADACKKSLKSGLAPKEVINKITPEKMRLIYYPIRRLCYYYSAEVNVKSKFKQKEYYKGDERPHVCETSTDYTLSLDGYLNRREVAHTLFASSGLEYQFNEESKRVFKDSFKDESKRRKIFEKKEGMMSFPYEAAKLAPLIYENKFVDRYSYPADLFKKNFSDCLGDVVMDNHKATNDKLGTESGKRTISINKYDSHLESESIQYVPVWVTNYNYEGKSYRFGYDELFRRKVGDKHPVSKGKRTALILTIVGVILAIIFGLLVHAVIKRLNIPSRNDYSNWTPPDSPGRGGQYIASPLSFFFTNLKLLVNYVSIMFLN